MHRCVFLSIVATLPLLMHNPSPLRAQDTPDTNKDNTDDFQALTYEDAHGGKLLYRLLVPDESDKPMPVLVFLHGAGERGDDNEKQLFWGKDLLRTAAREYHCLVIAPQCPAGDFWANIDRSQGKVTFVEEPPVPLRQTNELIDDLATRYNIDKDRLYIMGLSMGGFGSWDAITRWPGRFAATAPICGGGDAAQAEVFKDTPIWAFHGEADTVVPVAFTRDVVQAIRDAGGNPSYTEYPGVGHNSWTPAFAEPDLLPWMMKQRLNEADAGKQEE